MSSVEAGPTVERSKVRRILMQGFSGMIVGAGGAAAMLLVIEQRGGALEEPARVGALMVALVYVLIGAIVAVGAAVPGIGTRALNVEDAADLRQQRSSLLLASLVMLLIGAGMAALALYAGQGPDALLSRQLSLILFGGSLVAATALTIATRGIGDELTRVIGKEAGALTASLTFLLFGGWAALAHLEFAPFFAPLTLISGMLALYLLSIFVVAARRGSLT